MYLQTRSLPDILSPSYLFFSLDRIRRIGLVKTNKQVHDERVTAINMLLQTIKVIAVEFEIQNGGTLQGLTTGLILSINSTFAENIREARIALSDDSRFWSIKYHTESFQVLDTVKFDEKERLTGEGKIYIRTDQSQLTAAQDAASELSKVKNWIHN